MNVVMNFAVFNGSPNQEGPDPRQRKNDFARGCGWACKAGNKGVDKRLG